MRKDIRVQFDCEIASEKSIGRSKSKDKKIIHLADHICASVKEQVSESNVLFLPSYQRNTTDKIDTSVMTFFID